jgi:hypothetical protein
VRTRIFPPDGRERCGRYRRGMDGWMDGWWWFR